MGVIVTGGTQGIGRAIAEAFLGAGREVVVCSRRAPREPPAAGGRSASWKAADVRDPDEVERLVAFAVERLGRIDVLVNNAGGSPPAPAATASPRLVAAVVSLNLVAPFVVAQRVNAVMQEQPEGGLIVNIASTSGTRPSPGTAAYGAAKAGLINLTRTLAVEWGPRVRVNAVTPGLIRTEAAAAHGAGGGDPADVAAVCLFLASPAARGVTGASVLVHAE